MSAFLMARNAHVPGASGDSAHAALGRLFEILAPSEADLVGFLECYFDESGSHDGSPVLCVAGYLFEKSQCMELDVRWKEVLDRYRLPYFRMSACAHIQPPYTHLSKEECIEAEKLMIGLINEYALLGVAVAVNEHDFNTWFDGLAPTGSAYSFCCWQVLSGIQVWIRQNNFQGEVAYFYEAGHESWSEANAHMKRIFNNPKLRTRYRYASHTFADKQKVRPLQAADMLAWHQATQVKRWLKNNFNVRADFRALAAKPRHEIFIGNQKTAGEMIAYFRSLIGLPIRDGITGRFGSDWFWCSFDPRRREWPGLWSI